MNRITKPKLIILCILFFIKSNVLADSGKILYHSENEYGPIWIHETSAARCLSFVPIEKSNVRQTCIIPEDPKRLIFKYQKIALSALYLNTNPKKILLIGLGGGTLAKALMDILPDVAFDIVEINPDVEKVAKQFFFFKLNKNTKVFLQDGYLFIEDKLKNNQKYDFIIIDAFTPDYIPESFITKQFATMLKGILSPEGVLAVNTFVDSKSYDLETTLYKNEFGKIINLQYSGNRMIFAVNGQIPSPKTIEENSLIWEEKFEHHGVMTNWLMSVFKQRQIISNPVSN
jgi:spermidine synthase